MANSREGWNADIADVAGNADIAGNVKRQTARQRALGTLRAVRKCFAVSPDSRTNISSGGKAK